MTKSSRHWSCAIQIFSNACVRPKNICKSSLFSPFKVWFLIFKCCVTCCDNQYGMFFFETHIGWQITKNNQSIQSCNASIHSMVYLHLISTAIKEIEIGSRNTSHTFHSNKSVMYSRFGTFMNLFLAQISPPTSLKMHHPQKKMEQVWRQPIKQWPCSTMKKKTQKRTDPIFRSRKLDQKSCQWETWHLARLKKTQSDNPREFTPPKFNMKTSKWCFPIRNLQTSSGKRFSGSMLNFRGVHTNNPNNTSWTCLKPKT